MSDYGDIAGLTIVVTGASSGLGRHFAAFLAQRGAKVAAGARRIDQLEDLSAELAGTKGEIHPFQLDVQSVASIAKAIDEVEARFGRIDALINNAGLANSGRMLEVGEQEFDQMFDTNVRGAFFMSQICGRRMIEAGRGGAIVNIASAAGLVQMPQLGVYGMTKAAIIHMTKALAAEWAAKDINVNAICPGYIDTNINRDFFASASGGRVIDSLPRKRIGEPKDLEAALLLFLSRKGSRLISGTVLSVDDAYAVA